MPQPRRFRDWSDLDDAARRAAAARHAAYARAVEPRLNAFVAFEEIPARASTGPLGGMPYVAKDMFATSHRRPSWGLDVAPPPQGHERASVLARMDQVGGVCLGYVTMTELAYEPSGHNAARASARNPWNPDFITGGSSSGSAVAVASGGAIVALGSDTAGSLRIPANACGVTAWKPSQGLIPMHGTMPLAPTLDTVGLLGRSARDIAPTAMALAGLQQPAAAPPRTAAVLADVIAATEAPVARAVRNGIAAIEAVGVTLTQRGGQGAIETSDEPVFAILQAEAARAHGDTLRSGAVRSELAQRLRKGLDIDERPYLAGRAAAISAFLETVFADADVLLLPVMPIRTPPAKACDPTASAFHPRTLYALSRWTRFVNFLGFPSVAVPVGFDDRDMPVALQIVGKPGRDMELIVVAAAMQSKTDWHARVPPGVADLAASMLPDEVI